jgi:hypothetical protein
MDIDEIYFFVEEAANRGDSIQPIALLVVCAIILRTCQRIAFHCHAATADQTDGKSPIHAGSIEMPCTQVRVQFR